MKKKPSVKKKPAPKKRSARIQELRAKLMERNIEFTENEGIEALQAKLKTQTTAVALRKDASLPYTLFDEADDQQILMDLQGKVVNKFLYRFEQDGKEVVGLSKSGVEHVCRTIANKKGEVYRVLDFPQIQEDAESVTVTVKAGRFKVVLDKQGRLKTEVLLDTTFGSKRQPKKMKKRDQTTIADKFYYEKALSKAIRNAKMALIPYVYITEMVKLLEKKPEHVQTISAKIGEPQLKYIHGVVQSFFGLNDYEACHQKAREILKQTFPAYASLNDLQMDQVDILVAKIKSLAPRKTKMPIELIGECNAKNILPAKREALWQKALDIAKGDVGQATELMKQELERVRTDEQKG